MSESAYTRKLAEAKAIIEEHNSHLGENSEARLDWDSIVPKIKEMGATTDETLREMSWEDLQDAGVPRILARRIANNVFRKNGDDKKPKVLTPNKVGALSFVELFELYDVTGETNPAVRDRLLRESDGRRCVVLDPTDNTKVLVSESAKALRELKDGFPEQDAVPISIPGGGGKLAKLYRVGENPNEFVDENFLYPGTMLRNGRCDTTGRDVSKIPLEARQIIYLAITETEELQVVDAEDAHRVLDMLDCEDPIDKVQARYGRAALLLQERRHTGDDPKLKMKKNGNGSEKPNDPFNTGRHVRT